LWIEKPAECGLFFCRKSGSADGVLFQGDFAVLLGSDLLLDGLAVIL
jgi:hypothetical protein